VIRKDGWSDLPLFSLPVLIWKSAFILPLPAIPPSRPPLVVSSKAVLAGKGSSMAAPLWKGLCMLRAAVLGNDCGTGGSGGMAGAVL
jgi:hypothetical protein